jgi:hypothetical protein
MTSSRMTTEKIMARIARALADGDPLQALASGLTPTDLQSLMLHVYRQRSRHKSPAELLSLYERTAMLRPSTADARRLGDIERVATQCAPAFEAVALSPVAPLGINTVLGEIDQNNCLATIRNGEVLADPTTALALEAALRRRAGTAGIIELCSCARALRLQPFDVPGFSPHFALFSMISAGRDRGSRAFEMQALRDHIGVYLKFLDVLQGRGYRFAQVEVNLTETANDDRVLRQAQAEVLEPLAAEHPAADFGIDQSREQGRSYYKGLCIGLYAKDPAGVRMNIGDGGFTDWTQRLLSNGKERLLVSAIGIELIAKRFAG